VLFIGIILLCTNLAESSQFPTGSSTKRTGRISGTPYWMAPEYLRGEKEYDTACDMYSVGVILYEIYARKSPYDGQDYRQVIRGVCNRRVNKRPEIPEAAPPKFVEIMKKCWSPDAAYRPTAGNLDMALIEMSASDAEPIDEGTRDQRKRTGDMLYELFPRHIANAIKNGEKVEPESHELVTVIFSDIIHFTDISRTISPEKGTYLPTPIVSACAAFFLSNFCNSCVHLYKNSL